VPDATPEDVAQDRAEVEGDCVVEERLADKQGQAEGCSLRVLLESHLRDLAEGNHAALAHGEALSRLGELRIVPLIADRLFDPTHEPLRLLLASVDEQPARALGDVAAHEQDAETDHGSGAEREPPAEVRGEDVGVQEEERCDRADPGAEPVTPVDV
jgi:hypothetical protein